MQSKSTEQPLACLARLQSFIPRITVLQSFIPQVTVLEKIIVLYPVEKFLVSYGSSFHHLVHNSPPFDPIINQINPFHALPYFLTIHFPITVPSVPRS